MIFHFQWHLPLTLPSPRAGTRKAGATRGERIKGRGHARFMQRQGEPSFPNHKLTDSLTRELRMKITLHTGKFLALVKEGRWEYVDRLGATGAVIVVAVTNERKLLLVEQYRIPVHARTIELPAGIVGDDPGGSDEGNTDAAKRELLEETGYAAERVETLTTGPASSGLTSEVVTLLLASDLKRVQAGGGVAHENITVHEVPLSEVHDWLAAKASEGLLIEPKVYAGLYFIERGK